ncbi:unnamed protein product [Didymodactylos carnosus]|uniref:Cysteine and tyrosine-rich protein 1 n=1 Tax=Didymodactylos carnosus TaxID=1234261 RepID=A0A814W550_9BILA|nr:unnamed protein product [Didymodactylos carnosus]CAF3961960.1 unnamed protein product [Didymodactylos carnosus]
MLRIVILFLILLQINQIRSDCVDCCRDGYCTSAVGFSAGTCCYSRHYSSYTDYKCCTSTAACTIGGGSCVTITRSFSSAGTIAGSIIGSIIFIIIVIVACLCIRRRRLAYYHSPYGVPAGTTYVVASPYQS